MLYIFGGTVKVIYLTETYLPTVLASFADFFEVLIRGRVRRVRVSSS
jgi:hypothetical protein